MSDDEPFIPRLTVTRLKKWIRLRAALIVVVVGLFIAVVVVSVKFHNQDTSTSGSQVCLTEECTLASASILSKMDHDIDPCVDLYSYACGRWLKNTEEVPDYLKGWNIEKDLETDVHKTLKKILKSGGNTLQGKNSTAIEKLKKFYQQCMDEESIENEGVTRVLELISELGSWTLTTNNITPWNNKTWSLQKSIEQMHMLNINGLFTMSVTEETDDDKSNYILQFQNSGLTYDVNDYPTVHLFLLISTFTQFLDPDSRNKLSLFDKVVNFETQLAQIVKDSEKEGEEIVNLDILQELFSPWFNASHYLTERFNGIHLPYGINVTIKNPSYFHKLKDFINGAEKEVLANYMMWRFIFSITDALPEIFNANKKISYYHADIPPRYEICINKTTHVLDLAISALYVDSNFQFNFQSRPKVSATVHKITNEIVTNLKNLKWLDYRTLKHLEKKSELLKYNIGYPDWIMDVDKLDEHYKQLKVEGEKYLDNYLNTSRYINRKNLELLWKSPDEQWIQSPIAGAPFYFNRTIYITTGYIQPPFYDPTFPVAFYYGSIGFLAAQETLHDFHVDHSWSKPTKDKYFNRAKCFHDQYDKYIVQGQPMNSSLDEYIFDNGAVRHTFQVYKENDEEQYKIFPGLNLTEDQLFFLGFSQSMCSVYSQPKKTAMKDFSTYEMYRVIGSLSNSEDFAKAFNCPVNSSMNPENKCQIW